MTPVDEKKHELLFCLSGRFKKNQISWHITSKEAYPLVKAIREAAHLLYAPERPIQIYTDHRNLLRVFCPIAMDTNAKRYTVERLMRWSLELQSVHYVIHHIPGEKNVLADFLSRRGCRVDGGLTRSARVTAMRGTKGEGTTIRAVLEEARTTFRTHRVQALLDNDLWPSREQIMEVQRASCGDEVDRDCDGEGLLMMRNGKVVLPATAISMISRLIVVAHFGEWAQGSRAGFGTAREPIRY